MGEKFWQICELEELVRSFIELSVAAVPESWVIRNKDGSLICYWPKEDPGKKIRSFTDPKDGGNWKTYKCRFLMNGAKFSRYDEAREAEKIAQDLSCNLDCTRNVNSTMDYDVSDDDSDDDQTVSDRDSHHNESAASLVRDYSTMDFDVTVVDASEQIVGNDTMKFNNAALIGDVIAFKQADVADWLKSKPDKKVSSYASISSDESGYSNRFGLCNEFLTSTAIGGDASGLIEIESQATLSSIKALETNMLHRYQELKTDLQDIKQMLGCKCQDRTEPNQMPIWTANQAINEVIILDDISGDTGPTRSIQDKDLSNQNSMPILVTINSTNPINEIIPTMQETSMDNNEKHLKLGNVDDMPVHSPLPIEELHATDETFSLPNELKMNVVDIEEFRRNELVLEIDDEAKKNTVKRLLPLRTENEASYMKRTISLLFSEDFFLDYLTWKPEKGRQCIKNTNILKCWKASFEPQFGADQNNKRIMAHFRRLKSCKRASIKTATGDAGVKTLKRKANSANEKYV